jgi:hypothetical protein
MVADVDEIDLMELSLTYSRHPRHARLMELAETGEWQRLRRLIQFGVETREEVDALPPPDLTGLQGIIDAADDGRGYNGLTR